VLQVSQRYIWFYDKETDPRCKGLGERIGSIAANIYRLDAASTTQIYR
jgi:hypothetical protein